jgi:hypothetical protein
VGNVRGRDSLADCERDSGGEMGGKETTWETVCGILVGNVRERDSLADCVRDIGGKCEGKRQLGRPRCR